MQDEKAEAASNVPDEKDAASIKSSSVTPLEGDEAEDNIKDPYTGSTQQHAFSHPSDAKYWTNVYEEAKYEGRHRFDPSFQWDSSEEKKLIRKVPSTSNLHQLLEAVLTQSL